MGPIIFNNEIVIPVGTKYGYNVEIKYKGFVHNRFGGMFTIMWDILFKDEFDNEVNNLTIRRLSMNQVLSNAQYVDNLTGVPVTVPPANIDDVIGEHDYYWRMLYLDNIVYSDLLTILGNIFTTTVLNSI